MRFIGHAHNITGDFHTALSCSELPMLDVSHDWPRICISWCIKFSQEARERSLGKLFHKNKSSRDSLNRPKYWTCPKPHTPLCCHSLLWSLHLAIWMTNESIAYDFALGWSIWVSIIPGGQLSSFGKWSRELTNASLFIIDVPTGKPSVYRSLRVNSMHVLRLNKCE